MHAVPDSHFQVELEVENLSCRRGERLLFEDLSWRAGAGMRVMVQGANGTGKTSLLRLLAGLGLPERGTVRRQGPLEWLGHADGLKADLTPRENLYFHQALYGSDRDADRALADAGLGSVADLPCRSLSAGQRRRAALARLAISRAALWLLDEPMTALDEEGRHWVEAMVGAHCAGGGIAVLTSHQPFHSEGAVLEVRL